MSNFGHLLGLQSEPTEGRLFWRCVVCRMNYWLGSSPTRWCAGRFDA